MKKRKLSEYSYLFLTLLLISGCSREYTVNVETPVQKNKVIPIEEALASLQIVMNDAGFGTKAVGIDENKLIVETICIASGTKACSGAIGSEPLLYCVNFYDEDISAVLSANTIIKEPVICLVDDCKISPFELARAYDEVSQSEIEATACTNSEEQGIPFDEMTEEEMEALLEGINNGSSSKEYLYEILANYIDKELSGIKKAENTDPTIGHTQNKNIYGPYIKTKWGQGWPYNIYIGEAAGCVTIATAQVLYRNSSISNLFPDTTGRA